MATAERIAGVLQARRLDACVIGAAAMAIHGYVRATADLDFATVVEPSPTLSRLAKHLSGEGLDAEFFEPEPEDPLGGVVRVFLSEDSTIDVVNFLNPWHAGAEALVRDAIAQATVVEEGSALRVAPLAHLIGLKLYAAGGKSRGDIEELLRANPSFPREALPGFLARFGLKAEWARLEPLLRL